MAVALFGLPTGAGANDPPAVEATEAFYRSYDGHALIRTVTYVPAGVDQDWPAAAILAGHHGGGPDDADGPDPEALNDTLRALLDAGFIVQTWAARGFAPSRSNTESCPRESGCNGEGHLNSPLYEVEDVRLLLDKLAERDDVILDRPGDPRVGMVGESYGAWIQLLSAAVDNRIDAINPRWTIYDPVQDFAPNGVLRSGWTATIAAVVASRDFHEDVDAVFSEALLHGKLKKRGRDFLGARSVVPGLRNVKVPTLLVQSVSDTLTTANNAIAIYEDLDARGVPTKLYLHCGGHTQTLLVGNPAGISCDPTRAPSHVPPLVVNWMNTHLRGVPSPLSLPIEWELQDGPVHSGARLPSAASEDALQTTVPKALLVRTGDPYEGVAVAATPSPDGVRATVPAAEGRVLLGVPTVSMTVTTGQAEGDTGVEVPTERSTEVYVFSKLLDRDLETGKLLVIDEQATPMSFSMRAGIPQTKSFDLAAIAWKVDEGHELLYEVSATSSDYAASRDPSIAEVSATVRVPVFVRTSAG